MRVLVLFAILTFSLTLVSGLEAGSSEDAFGEEDPFEDSPQAAADEEVEELGKQENPNLGDVGDAIAKGADPGRAAPVLNKAVTTSANADASFEGLPPVSNKEPIPPAEPADITPAVEPVDTVPDGGFPDDSQIFIPTNPGNTPDPAIPQPEPQPPISGPSTITNDDVNAVPPQAVRFMDPAAIDLIADKLTAAQVQTLPPDMIAQLHPNSIRHIADFLSIVQVAALTEAQVQAFSTEEIELILRDLPVGPQRDSFLNKLSDIQLIRFIRQNPNTENLPPEVLQRYAELVDEGITLDPQSDALIEGTDIISGDLRLDMGSTEGSVNIVTLQDGFLITSEEGGVVSIDHPHDNIPVEFDIPPGGEVEVTLTDELEFAIKASEFVNVNMNPPDFGTVTIISKQDDSVTMINPQGEYSFSQAILQFTSPEFTEFVDTNVESKVTVDRRAGIICSLLTLGANYTLQQNEKHEVTSQSYVMYLCIRKGEYVEEDKFSQLRETFSTSGIPYNEIDTVDASHFYTAPLEYKLEGGNIFSSFATLTAEQFDNKLAVSETNPGLGITEGFHTIVEGDNRLLYWNVQEVVQSRTEYSSGHPAKIRFLRDQACGLSSLCNTLPTTLVQELGGSTVRAYDLRAGTYSDEYFVSMREQFGVFT